MEFQITAQAFSQTDNYNANIQALVSQRGVGSNLPRPLFFVILFILQREKKISTENFSNFFLAKKNNCLLSTILMLPDAICFENKCIKIKV